MGNTAIAGKTPVTRTTEYPISVPTMDAVREVLAEAKQPVTLAEVTTALRARRHISSYTVREVLNRLVGVGFASARFETESEARLRVSTRGNATPGRPAILYFATAANGTNIPERTLMSVLAGVDYSVCLPEIKSGNDRRAAKKKTSKQGRLAKVAATVQTGTRFDRIEARLSKVEALEKRVAELESTIAMLTNALR